MAAGINEFCLISTPEDLLATKVFRRREAVGEYLSITESRRNQRVSLRRLLSRTLLSETMTFVSCLAITFFGGDHFPRAVNEFESGATVFAYHVSDPCRYGVVDFDHAT